MRRARRESGSGPAPASTHRRRALAGVLLLLCACADEPQQATAPAEQAATETARGFHFVDAAAQAGLTRVTHAGRPDKDHLLDSAGVGLAWLDYDRDGHLDAFLVNGWKLAGSEILERGEFALYRGRGDGTFEDVTAAAGVAGEGRWASGVSVADHDLDGWPDLFVTCFGRNLLYRNDGDGTFSERAAAAGVEAPGWNTGAAFFDADGDGDLDLYVAAYIDCTLEEVLEARTSLRWKAVADVAMGPFGLDGARDHFFLADGSGAFVEATSESRLDDLALGFGFAVLASDFDLDGDADLYVANDSDANYYYRNEGRNEGGALFKEVGMWTGSALDNLGNAQAGMGAARGDADGDGTVDIFVTNFAEDFSTLYAGDGRGFFSDVSQQSGVGQATYQALSWGTVFADLDNDGDEDLVVANGHIYPQVDRHPEQGMTYGQRNTLLENVGQGRFVDATERAGPGFQVALSSRGLAAGDYDDDGDLDLLFSNLDAPPTLLRNESATGAWLMLDCRVPPGRTRIGTRAVVEAGDLRVVRELTSGGSYLSAHDPRLHFGLGEAQRAERIEVRFPGGAVVVLEDVAANQLVVVEAPE